MAEAIREGGQMVMQISCGKYEYTRLEYRTNILKRS